MTDTYAYLGAQDQGTAVADYNALVFIIRQEIAKVRTGIPVKIVRAPYDASGAAISPGAAGPIGYVDVQPMINQLDGYGTATPHSTVYKLSYHRFQGGNGAFISDPVEGDIGHMSVADRDTSSVRATSAVSNPGSGRTHDLADGTFFGQTQAGTPAQHFSFLAKGFNLTDAYGNTLIGTAAGVTVNGALIDQTGNLITKKGTDLDNHLTSEVTPGGGVSGPPVV